MDRRIRNAPFIELTDSYRHPVFIHCHRIVAVRPPSYDGEKPYGSVVVAQGIQTPWIMDDSMEDILELMEEAAAAAPRAQALPDTSFIPLEFESGEVMYVDYQRIVAIKDVSGGSHVFVDGLANADEDGRLHYSIAPLDSAHDILTAIREAERRLTEAA